MARTARLGGWAAAMLGVAVLGGCASQRGQVYQSIKVGKPIAGVEALKQWTAGGTWLAAPNPKDPMDELDHRTYVVVIGANGVVLAKGFVDDAARRMDGGTDVAMFLAIRGQDVPDLMRFQLASAGGTGFQPVNAAATTQPEPEGPWGSLSAMTKGWPFAAQSNQQDPYGPNGALMRWGEFVAKAQAGQLDGVVAIRGRMPKSAVAPNPLLPKPADWHD